jgi:hypothetical protein
MFEKGNEFLVMPILNKQSTIPGLGQGAMEYWSDALVNNEKTILPCFGSHYASTPGSMCVASISRD